MHRFGRQRQQGVILLAFALVLVVGASGVLLASLNNRYSRAVYDPDLPGRMLEAKEALLAYAAYYPDLQGRGPGRFPCPDLNNSGAAHPISSDVVYDIYYAPFNLSFYFPSPCETLGRLPEKVDLPNGAEFALSSAYAGIDRQFWYYAAMPFRDIAYPPILGSNHPKPVNTASIATISLDGVGNFVAVLIAPGDEVQGQSRVSNQLDAQRYLEQDNTDIPDFISRFGANPELFNDRVVGITAEELWQRASWRVAMEVKRFLDLYHADNGAYPDDADFISAANTYATAWFIENDWQDVTGYGVVGPNPQVANIEFEDAAGNCLFAYIIAQVSPVEPVDCP